MVGADGGDRFAVETKASDDGGDAVAAWTVHTPVVIKTTVGKAMVNRDVVIITCW